MKTKDKLLLFLALNSVTTPLMAVTSKYEKLYDKMTKNLETEKSNDNNYELIENILKKRNKELKDLYLQNDYIVKSEHLEWQIFYEGFYNNVNKGGKKDTVISKSESGVKTIDFGMYIPIKGIERDDVILNLTSVKEPVVNANLRPVIGPEVSQPNLVYTDIQFSDAPVIETFPELFYYGIGILDSNIRTKNIRYNLSGDVIFENLNVDSPEGTDLRLDLRESNVAINGGMKYSNGDIYGESASVYTHAMSGNFDVNNIGNAGNFEVKGNWDFSLVNKSDNQHWISFLAYRPYYQNQDGKVLFSGNLGLSVSNTRSAYLSGLTLNLSYRGASPSGKAVLENTGNITISGSLNSGGITGMHLMTDILNKEDTQSGELINSGNIIIETIGTMDAAGAGITVKTDNIQKSVLVNTGNILVKGEKNIGVYLTGRETNGQHNTHSNLIVDGSNGKIVIEGNGNSGIQAWRSYTSTENSMLDNVRNMNMLINGTEASAISINATSLAKVYDLILNDTLFQSLEFGENSYRSQIAYLNTMNTLILDSSLANVLTDINTGTRNAIAVSVYDGTIKNYMPIKILSGAKAMTGIHMENGSLENYADIENNSTEYIDDSGKIYGGIGLALKYFHKQSTALNKGNIDMSGNYATAVYNTGSNFTSESDHIVLTGKKATAFYGGLNTSYVNGYDVYVNSQTNIKANKLEVTGDNSTLIYSDGGNFNIGTYTPGQAMELAAGGGDTFGLFVQKNSYTPLGKITLTSDVNLNIKNGATAFYYEGNNSPDTADLSSYLDTIIATNNNKLSVNVDENSYSIAVKNSLVNLSNLINIGGTGIEVKGSKGAKLSYSKLVLDADSNLDKNNITGDKTYRDSVIMKSGIDILKGVTLSGTEDNLIGISQSYDYDDFIQEKSKNKGIINLTGNNSVGIYSKGSEITNTGLIDVSGSKSTGMYLRKGTVSNDGEIIIGDQGIGIYGETYLESDNDQNTFPLYINNSGKITAGTGSNAVGIYGNNNLGTNINVSGGISLSDGTDIDVSASKGGIGVYASGLEVNSTGKAKISVGENGIGIYIKDSNAVFSNLELNLRGDNSIGVYTDGSGSFNGTGNINIDGTGIIVFNVIGSGGFNQNFNINSVEGSQYILQNLKDTTLYFGSTGSLGVGGTLVSGINSAVLLDENSDLSSKGSNVIGIALTGAYANGLPININGQILDHEATNKGRINFGDNSAGIYVINGASGKNTGEISLGKDSVALYGSGNGTNIENVGQIYLGGNSVGLYHKAGNNVSNAGIIESTGTRTTGMYLDGDTNSQGTNTGIINLLGENSVGIYISENGVKAFNNSGQIEIGDSISAADPGIGIFNNNVNGTVNNTANLISGKNSMGIYNNSGNINHASGNITIGENGTGVYTTSGNVNLSGGVLNLNGTDAIGIYGAGNAAIITDMQLNISENSYGLVLNGEANLTNKNISTLKDKGVLLYSDGNTTVRNESGAAVNMTGSNSAGFYMKNGGKLENRAEITGNTGLANIGIYNKSGSVENSGNIKIGDSRIIDKNNPFLNEYALGIYGEDTETLKNSGDIEIGSNSIGIYINGNLNEALNTGNISSISENSIGIYSEHGALINEGNITLSGNGSIGIAAARSSIISNFGTITMNGNNSIGIYGNAKSQIINESTGKIYINGNNSTGVQLSDGSVLENYGLIEIAGGTIGSTQIVEGEAAYIPPSIINAGIIKVDEKFELNGFDLIIKPDPESFRVPTIEEVRGNEYSLEDMNGGFLLSNKVNITAPGFDFGGNSAVIDPLFTQGTNARVYKFENVFDPKTEDGGPNTGEVSVKSGSLTFEATPVSNDQGKIDIWMEKIDYDNFTHGAWYDGFAKNIEGKYLNATGEALKLYDKLDLIKEEEDLRSSFEQLSGNMYSNVKQREQDIYGVFNKALDTLQNSENNTKENVKVSIIGGKGRTKENTSGVESYDYNTMGILGLREVERTYRHKIGYSLGYTRTNFEMDNSNNEDRADTIQLGLHNNYSINGWNFKNDLLGRVSKHDVKRNINWYDGEKSELKSDYNVYGVNSLNEVNRDIDLGRNIKLTPYAGLEMGYMSHEGFDEEGFESLKVKSDDGYSIKPKVGVRLGGEKELGSSSNWKLKGDLDLAYEYELGDMNKNEKASLSSIEEGYHDLAKAGEDKGRIKTGVKVGVELKEKYGVYVTGEYGRGDKDREDYKVGLSFKASF